MDDPSLWALLGDLSEFTDARLNGSSKTYEVKRKATLVSNGTLGKVIAGVSSPYKLQKENTFSLTSLPSSEGEKGNSENAKSSPHTERFQTPESRQRTANESRLQTPGGINWDVLFQDGVVERKNKKADEKKAKEAKKMKDMEEKAYKEARQRLVESESLMSKTSPVSLPSLSSPEPGPGPISSSGPTAKTTNLTGSSPNSHGKNDVLPPKEKKKQEEKRLLDIILPTLLKKKNKKKKKRPVRRGNPLRPSPAATITPLAEARGLQEEEEEEDDKTIDRMLQQLRSEREQAKLDQQQLQIAQVVRSPYNLNARPKEYMRESRKKFVPSVSSPKKKVNALPPPSDFKSLEEARLFRERQQIDHQQRILSNPIVRTKNDKKIPERMKLLSVLDDLLEQIASLQDRIYNEQVVYRDLNEDQYDEENGELLDCLKVVAMHVSNHHNHLSSGRSVAKNPKKSHGMQHTSISASAETWKVTLLTVVDTLARRPSLEELFAKREAEDERERLKLIELAERGPSLPPMISGAEAEEIVKGMRLPVEAGAVHQQKLPTMEDLGLA